MKVWMKIVALVAASVLCCTAQTSAPSSAPPGGSGVSQTASQTEISVTSLPAQPNSAPPQAQQTVPEAASPTSAPAAETILASPPAKKPGAASAGDSAPPAKGSANLYVIGPLDVLYVKVWNQPNLTGMVDVQDDGMISMALIGQLKAEGLTIDELTKLISSKLEDFFQSTEGEVTVQLTKNNSKKYYIMGQGAGRQGAFPLNGKLTISEALANAGGYQTFANIKKIYLLRKSENYKTQHKFNLKDVLAGKHMEDDIEVENGDRIVVPE
jgi:polysaccharide biosynthesis/export protein